MMPPDPAGRLLIVLEVPVPTDRHDSSGMDPLPPRTAPSWAVSCRDVYLQLAVHGNAFEYVKVHM